MTERGFSYGAIKALWDTLLPFSDYAFNKAHSAAYGLVSYWTAYLKANYPAEYMAALLTSVKDDKDKMAIYLNECRRMNGVGVMGAFDKSVDGEGSPGAPCVRIRGFSLWGKVGVRRKKRRAQSAEEHPAVDRALWDQG